LDFIIENTEKYLKNNDEFDQLCELLLKYSKKNEDDE
jgi:hypothetical protein